MSYIGKVYLTTMPDGSFYSSGSSWTKNSISRIKKIISEGGFDVSIIAIQEVANLKLSKKDIVIYTSSESTEVRNYLKDVLFIVNKKCHLVPNYESLLAHENKGFQQLYREYCNFGRLKGNYNFDNILSVDIHYPYVYKTITGAGSSGVYLVKSPKDQNKIYRKLKSIDLNHFLKNIIRKFQLSSEEYKTYQFRKKKFDLYVTQEFIKGLQHDYKVLIFGEKYYTLKRNVRKNDFRASGSGSFEFEEAPTSILDFAKEVYDQLDVPFASLDIAYDGDVCYLIEYQILNFGPMTLTRSTGYFVKEKSGWIRKQVASELSENFGYALTLYLKIYDKQDQQAR